MFKYGFFFMLLFSVVLIFFYWRENEPSSLPTESIISLEAPVTQTNSSFFESLPRKTECDSVHPAVDDDKWLLIWHDEFSSACIDDLKWNVENWAAEKNNELQYYLPENVIVQDGFMQLISRKESFGGRTYTSGAIHTKGKFNMLYGKIEMRAKLPAGKGIFPAFWLMTDKEDTWLPEIDIMEMLGQVPNEIWMVVHWMNQKGRMARDFESFKGPDFSADFHTFGIEWTPDSITWLIDGEVRFTSTAHVPEESMYIYVNTAVGGNWPGSPDSTTEFPVTFAIDYIRVFSLKESLIYHEKY